MSKKINLGGAAFPHVGSNGYAYAEGMTLRDYFMAHAPAEPQEWFDPKMSAPRPEPTINFPESLKDRTPAETRELTGLNDWLDVEDLKEPRVIEYAKQRLVVKAHHDEISRARREWDREQQKQRYIQWPAAWADAMLEQRAKVDAA